MVRHRIALRSRGGLYPYPPGLDLVLGVGLDEGGGEEEGGGGGGGGLYS